MEKILLHYESVEEHVSLFQDGLTKESNDVCYVCLGGTEVKRIEAAMDDWEKFTCIRFVRRTMETSYISIVKGSG